jgi:ribonuclease P protein component
VRWYDRLRRAGEIAQVRRKGRRTSLATFSLFVLPATSGSTRVGVTVSKTVGGAVTRNLVRRRILGALDGLAPQPAPARLLFIAKPAAASESYARLAADVAGALGSLRSPGN